MNIPSTITQPLWLIFSLFLLSTNSLISANDSIRDVKKPNIQALSPSESHKLLKVMKPFKADLVASEPMVNEPICMAWGGDGALYVVELRGYMQDINHTGAQEPVGRVVRLVDENGDGIMDKQTVFVDKLVEPRSIMAVKGAILVGSPPDLFYCKDTNGDGVADIRKSIFDRFAGRNGNVEHKTNGLLWGIDNWIYNAKSASKYRYLQDENGGKIIEGQTGFRGQWGITHDNLGHIYATSNSSPWIGEQIAYDYLTHNKLAFDDKFSRLTKMEDDFKTVWPLIETPDVQAGRGILRKEDLSLSRFTAIGGQTIFRGDKLGDDMVGSYIIPEPVGRLVRLSTITHVDGYRFLKNPNRNKQVEFIASEDGNFRPVYTYTGPDGCLYIVDMYRGIIQDGNWTRPGSYLRDEILRMGYEKNIQRGRIYRIARDGHTPGKIPKFDSFSKQQLVAALEHPNGWWRDEAQKRLVLSGDKSLTSAIVKLLQTSSSALGRIHAIWTLQGLGAWTHNLAQQTLKDKDWQVVFSSIRASEGLLAKDQRLIKYLSIINSDDLKLAKQIILSLGTVNALKDVDPAIQAEANQLITDIAMKHSDKDIIILSTMASISGKEEQLLELIIKRQQPIAEVRNWITVLSRMIIKSQHVERAKNLLQTAIKAQPDYRQQILKGMGDALPKSGRGSGSRVSLIRFKEKPSSLTQLEQSAGMSNSYDRALKSASTWFTWPGEPRYDKTHGVVAMADWEQSLFNQGKTIYQSLCMACHGVDGKGIKAPDGTGLLAPSLAGNKRVEGKAEPVIKVLLHGLTGPINGKTYSGLMAPMGSNDDQWIAAILTYIRREWGNIGLSVAEHEVNKVRNKTKDRTTPWTDKELNKKN